MKLSVIIPVYNESQTLSLLMDALHAALDPLKIEWEAVMVDDASTDNSLQVMEQLAEINRTSLRVVVLRRNSGQTTAIQAGIDHSLGELIALMDADLQNDPIDLPMMLKKIDEGYDLVSGWRVQRQDTFLTRRLPSRIANALISWVTGVHLHDYGCMLKVYRREVITGFRLYGEMHRFIPAYAGWMGANIIEVPTHHHPRKYGKTKYGLERTFKVFLDLLVVKFLNSYAEKPIYLFGGTGILLILAATLTMVILIINRLSGGDHLIRTPLLQMSVMLFILGFQSVLMGLIAELLARTYHESQSKPAYFVRRVINPIIPPSDNA